MKSIGPIELLFVVFWVLGWLAFLLIAAYMWHRSNRRRLEWMHEERMTAMQKGIPLPELPDFRTAGLPRRNRRAPLGAAIVFLSLGFGGMAALLFSPIDNARPMWTLPLPLVFLGAGLLLYYFLTRNQPD